MAYQIYITDAIVCGSKHHNTADKNYLLFTRELGMLWATARSVREERSKQRYALQDFSIVRVSLVRGKTGWRVGSTEAIENPFMAAVGRQARGGVTYLMKQLRRYVHGEQPLAAAFDDMVTAQSAIAALEDVFAITAWQNVTMTRLLHNLGYVAASPVLRSLIAAPNATAALTEYSAHMDGEIERLVAQAGEVSHL